MGIIDFFYDLYDGERRKEADHIFVTAVVGAFVALGGLMIRYVSPDVSHFWRSVAGWTGWIGLAVALITGFLAFIAGTGRSVREAASKGEKEWGRKMVAFDNELGIERLRKENTQLKENQCPPTNPREQRRTPAPGTYR